MNPLVFIQDNQIITDSLTIAEMFGKDHNNVLKDIRKQAEYAGEDFGQVNFYQSSYINSQNKNMPKFNLTEEAFTLVVFSYNTKEAVQTKIKFIQEFKRMKDYIQKQEQQAQDPVELALQISLKNYQEIKGIKEDVTLLKDSMRIDGRQEFAIKSQGKAKVMETLGGYNSSAYNALSKKVFSRMWRDFKNHFVLPRSPDLPKSRFDEAVKFIAMWRPDTSMAMEIESYNNQTHLKLVQ